MNWCDLFIRSYIRAEYGLKSFTQIKIKQYCYQIVTKRGRFDLILRNVFMC